MNLIDLIKIIFVRPKKFIGVILAHIAPLIKDDEVFIKLKWKLCMNYPLNLNNPQTFNEKLQWIKLHDRKQIYTTLVDKYEVKKYVADIIGEEYIIPTIKVYDRVVDIDFDKLPNQFVLKWTHDSGGLVICKDKSKLNVEEARKKLRKGERSHYFWRSREWPYKNVKPRIIAEQYMEDEDGCELNDYKFFCFNGEAKVIQLDFDRFSGHKKNLYSTDWKLLPFSFNYPSHPDIKFEKPQKLDEMLKIAGKLSEGKAFLRVDLYWTGKRIYFGELTFFPASGLGKFKPEEWDYKLGEWINLHS